VLNGARNSASNEAHWTDNMTMAADTVRDKSYPALLCGIWAVSLALSLIIPASWDVAWRLEISERLLGTATLYRDIVELNPPLWFWSIVPSTFAANKLNVSSYAMMCVAIHVIIIPSLWLLDRCVVPLTTRRERRWLVFGAIVAMLLLPINQLGQREPPVLLAGLLWGGAPNAH
jgi:hypothetical protein